MAGSGIIPSKSSSYFDDKLRNWDGERKVYWKWLNCAIRKRFSVKSYSWTGKNLADIDHICFLKVELSWS
jgi:hypothetical protein